MEEELEFEPSVNAAHIGVAVRDGVVTLTGHVASYAEKIAAEKATQRVRGVKAIAEEIEVRYPYDGKRSDEEIAKRAVNVLDWNTQVPTSVKVKVERGWVTLSGVADWQYQREAAEFSVRKLDGVVGVTNTIALKDRPKAADVQKKIEDALKRNAALDAAAIHVTVANDKVSLTGRVHSWQERRIAEQAAWSAPGVKSVDDAISVAA
ncbi:transport-associated protein [Methylopila sp. Yamaguchi]|nr:transport-associated protein [Methylopila sp. Yamaguchi]